MALPLRADARAGAHVERAVGDGELVVSGRASTSLTDTPAIESAVSSLTLCAPGTVFTGPSFTELTVIATASESVAPSRRSTDRQRVGAVEVGVALVAERWRAPR